MVDEHISLSIRPSIAGTEDDVRKALLRNVQVDAAGIGVHVHGTPVTLSGDVHSWSEKQQAGRGAWASPNVTDVENLLYVQTS
ncbi:BON domain-containing protein [Arthrobacter agilis]|uniref:BON domain-containing protein n=1 Tax=Arthrobacter agilis TaxID=37921 RepID=UPI0023652BA0|nr:BON domain-containing protein [Arthrobacter agilis]WDF31860.1 BON domain-containing protein [Arthrobacter agilis]